MFTKKVAFNQRIFRWKKTCEFSSAKRPLPNMKGSGRLYYLGLYFTLTRNTKLAFATLLE